MLKWVISLKKKLEAAWLAWPTEKPFGPGLARVKKEMWASLSVLMIGLYDVLAHWPTSNHIKYSTQVYIGYIGVYREKAHMGVSIRFRHGPVGQGKMTWN